MNIVLTRRSLHLAVAGLVLGAGALPALAADIDVNVDASGLALRGYDPVAYFEGGQPTPGNPEITATHKGATYRFASTQHRDAFTANPDAYLPQYGGFCALGTAMGKKLDGDPSLWRVADGKLYLNVNAQAQEVWLRDIPGNISKANEQWLKIQDKPANSL